jgi:hypothetical protein
MELLHSAAERLGGIVTIEVDCRSIREETIERIENVLKVIVERQPELLQSPA